MHELVIDSARVIDGLGAPAREGGVAVAGSRIAAIGTDLGAARQRVDAEGLGQRLGEARRAYCLFQVGSGSNFLMARATVAVFGPRSFW